MERPRVTRYGLLPDGQRPAGEGDRRIKRYRLVPKSGRSALGVDRYGTLERIAGMQDPPPPRS